MRFDESIIKLSDNLVEKTCELETCAKRFYVKSRYAPITKWCSNNCLQIAYYRRRKNVENMNLDNALENERIDNSLKEEDMDYMQELLKSREEMADLKLKIGLQERDLNDLGKLKSELSSAKGQLIQSNSEVSTLKAKLSDLNSLLFTTREQLSTDNKKTTLLNTQLNDLRSRIDAYENDLENCYSTIEELEESLEDATQENLLLTEEKEELVLANLILQSKGTKDYSGGRINFSDIQKYLTHLEHKESEDFNLKVWNWNLSHKAGDSKVLITNDKND